MSMHLFINYYAMFIDFCLLVFLDHEFLIKKKKKENQFVIKLIKNTTNQIDVFL